MHQPARASPSIIQSLRGPHNTERTVRTEPSSRSRAGAPPPEPWPERRHGDRPKPQSGLRCHGDLGLATDSLGLSLPGCKVRGFCAFAFKLQNLFLQSFFFPTQHKANRFKANHSGAFSTFTELGSGPAPAHPTAAPRPRPRDHRSALCLRGCVHPGFFHNSLFFTGLSCKTSSCKAGDRCGAVAEGRCRSPRHPTPTHTSSSWDSCPLSVLASQGRL